MYGMPDGGDYADRYENVYNSYYDLEATGNYLDGIDKYISSHSMKVAEFMGNKYEATGNSAYFYLEGFFSAMTPENIDKAFANSVMAGLTEFVGNTASVAGALNGVNNFKLNGSPNWPKNDGFAGKIEEIILQPGTQIDRYGKLKGDYVSPAGTPYSMRALAPGSNNGYTIFEVTQPLKVKAGIAASWFGEAGGGIQYYLPSSTESLLGDSLKIIYQSGVK